MKSIAQRYIAAGKWSVTGWGAERPPLVMTTGLMTLFDDDSVMTLFENVLMTLFDDERCLMTTVFYDSI